jgi:hypothetical protein
LRGMDRMARTSELLPALSLVPEDLEPPNGSV